MIYIGSSTCNNDRHKTTEKMKAKKETELMLLIGIKLLKRKIKAKHFAPCSCRREAPSAASDSSLARCNEFASSSG